MATQKSIGYRWWSVNNAGNAVDIASVIANSTVVVRQTATNGTLMLICGFNSIEEATRFYEGQLRGCSFCVNAARMGNDLIGYSHDQTYTFRIQDLGLRGMIPDCWTLEIIRREE